MRFVRSQLLVVLGVAIFCLGSVLAQPWWWVKMLFGVMALSAAWLAWVFAYELAGRASNEID